MALCEKYTSPVVQSSPDLRQNQEDVGDLLEVHCCWLERLGSKAEQKEKKYKHSLLNAQP